MNPPKEKQHVKLLINERDKVPIASKSLHLHRATNIIVYDAKFLNCFCRKILVEAAFGLLAFNALLAHLFWDRDLR